MFVILLEVSVIPTWVPPNVLLHIAILTDAVFPAAVAFIVMFPALFPVNFPFVSITAIPLLVVSHFTVLFFILFGVSSATNWILSPTYIFLAPLIFILILFVVLLVSYVLFVVVHKIILILHQPNLCIHLDLHQHAFFANKLNISSQLYTP